MKAALRSSQAVVALESSLITHGLPRPLNREVALALEAQVRADGGIPATVAVLDGRVHAGLDPEELDRLSSTLDLRKASRRDLGVLVGAEASAGTTVAATAYVAHNAGIQVLATGGIGGVHRGSSGDISADLPVLAETPITVVCSGAKSILDLPRTLEWLETHGVPVVGWQTDDFPSFFSESSGLRVSTRVEGPEAAAQLLRSHWELGLASAVLICVPCPRPEAIPAEQVEQWIDAVEAEANEVLGGSLTPHLLQRLAGVSGGATLSANRALLVHNASVATWIARALSGRKS